LSTSASVEEDDFMKHVFIATCMAAACAIALSAQQTASSTMPQSGRRGGPMTLTGCVKAGDTPGTYMLTDIQRSDAGGGSGAATTTAGAATSSGGMGQGMGRGMRQLTLSSGAPDVDLSAHVGHKVEVTGTMSGGRGRMSGGATTDTGGGSGSMGGSATMSGQGRGMRSMTVTSVKMISSSCSE
jgi:hypothetical protein